MTISVIISEWQYFSIEVIYKIHMSKHSTVISQREGTLCWYILAEYQPTSKKSMVFVWVPITIKITSYFGTLLQKNRRALFYLYSTIWYSLVNSFIYLFIPKLFINSFYVRLKVLGINPAVNKTNMVFTLTEFTN